MSYEPRPDVMYQELKELRELVRQLLTGAPLGYTSITEGSLRVASNEGLLVEGSAKVEGWLVVTGTERVTGTLEVQGRLIASGAIELTGPTSIDGDTDITGDIDLTGTLRALGGGVIRVEGGESPATLADGRMEFDTGGHVEADVGAGGVRLRAGDAVVNAGNVASLRKGSTSVTAGPLGVTLNAPSGQQILLQGAIAATGLTAAPEGVDVVTLVYAPSTGRFYRAA